MSAVFTNRTRVMALTLLTLVPCLIYVAITLYAGYDLRVKDADAQLLATARTAARTINDQCINGDARLRAASDRIDLDRRLTARRTADLPAALREIRRGVPGLVAVSVNRTDGRLIAADPARGAVGAPKWFFDSSSPRSSILADVVADSASPSGRCLAIAVPLGPAARPVGYLAGCLRFDTARILEARDGAIVTLSDRTGAVLAEEPRNAALIARGERRRLSSALQKAPDGISTISAEGGPASAAAARAAAAGLTVIAVRPEGAAKASALFKIVPLVLIFLVCFSGLLVMAWRYPRLHERYEATRVALLEQNRNLKELDHAKSEFLANVSHDLWTPLASLQISLTGLLDSSIHWRPEQVRASLQLANHELSQLINRVRNLLEMARLDANADLGQKEPCDLVDSIAAALERLAPLLAERQVHADFPNYPLMFMCRQAQFEIVIMNLLDNALKYSPYCSPIYLKGERRGRDIYVSVRDCGPGVAPSDVELIFQQFYRAPNLPSNAGTGLGLAICKAIVENHGGVIGVLNPPGGGAEFWFSVPGMPKDRLD